MLQNMAQGSLCSCLRHNLLALPHGICSRVPPTGAEGAAAERGAEAAAARARAEFASALEPVAGGAPSSGAGDSTSLLGRAQGLASSAVGAAVGTAGAAVSTVAGAPRAAYNTAAGATQAVYNRVRGRLSGGYLPACLEAICLPACRAEPLLASDMCVLGWWRLRERGKNPPAEQTE